MNLSNIRSYLGDLMTTVKSNRWLLAVIIVAAVAGLYLLLNAWLIPRVVFAERTAANTYVAGVKVGGQNYEAAITELEDRLSATKIDFSTKDDNYSATATDAGFTLDTTPLRRQLASKSVIRPYGLSRELELPLQLDQRKLSAFIGELELKQHQPATDASFTVKNGELVVTKGKSGRGVNIKSLQSKLTSMLSRKLADTSQPLTFTELEPAVTAQLIGELENQILQRTNSGYSLGDGEITESATDADKSRWWQVNPDSRKLQLNQAQLENWAKVTATSFERKPTTEVTSKYTSGATTKVTTAGRVGRQLTNLGATTDRLIAAARDTRSAKLELQFKPIPFSKRSQTVDDTPRQRTITYQVTSRGSISSSLEQFADLAAQTLADSRGWANAGYKFVRVNSGGSFSMTLASAQEVGNASSGCSAAWSCRVGSSVLINDDRWRGATSAWNSGGGNLRDYRHMVVNHEVGHFLGNGHRYCGGSGQLAPVMQQQSIDLQGCRFNPWPTAAEIASNR